MRSFALTVLAAVLVAMVAAQEKKEEAVKAPETNEEVKPDESGFTNQLLGGALFEGG